MLIYIYILYKWACWLCEWVSECVCVCVCVCVCAPACLLVCVCMYVCLSVFVYIYVLVLFSFFQAAVKSILLNGCTTWTLTKLLEKKLDGNYTRMLRAILNKSWQQHPTRHQLYGHLPPITKTIQVRRTRHAGHCWRSRDELIWIMNSYGSPHMAAQKQDDQLERTFSSYVRIQDVVLKTYLGRWTIGRSGERGSGISVLPARYDDDDVCVRGCVNELTHVVSYVY